MTLTGLAERADEGGVGVDLGHAHRRTATALLDADDLRGVVLAGHSYAGIVVTAVADPAPRADRAGGFYVDSGPAPDGVSLSAIRRRAACT